jgi:uncharacterized protein YbjT (DUF2867 family)
MIFVTGGTGMVGGEIVRLLSQNGTAARALVRNPKNAKNQPVITWVTGDLAKPETLPAAFEGAKTLFLISSIAEDTVALQHNAIEAAREAGVTHIVKLSAFGASNHSKAPICVWHYQIEQEMQESGDHPPASSLYAEPSYPDRLHHQRRCRVLGFRRRQDPVH